MRALPDMRLTEIETETGYRLELSLRVAMALIGLNWPSSTVAF